MSFDWKPKPRTPQEEEAALRKAVLEAVVEVLSAPSTHPDARAGITEEMLLKDFFHIPTDDLPAKVKEILPRLIEHFVALHGVTSVGDLVKIAMSLKPRR